MLIMFVNVSAALRIRSVKQYLLGKAAQQCLVHLVEIYLNLGYCNVYIPRKERKKKKIH